MSIPNKMIFGAIAILVALSVSSTVVAGVVYTDDMEAYEAACDANIGDWKWKEFQYSDANCGGAPSGSYPGLSEAAAQLQDKFACTYYNIAGVVPAGDANAITGKSLAIADNAEGNGTACHRIQAAVELATDTEQATFLGEGEKVIYTFAAKVRSNQYGDNSPDSETGILLTILDINDGYSPIAEKKVAVDPASGDVSEKFDIDLTGKTNILVQVGFYAQANGDDQSQAQWDDLQLSWEKDEGEAEEVAACADTSVIRFEDPFGNATVTCKTDTYQIKKGANWWAGFGDTKRGEQYPFYFPTGGSITFDCQTASGTQAVLFAFEEEADTTGNLVQKVQATTEGQCTSTSTSVTVNVPASSTVWNNLILYLDTGIDDGVTTEDGPATVVKNITVNGSQVYVAPTTPTMVPALPVWGLLGLTGLVGFMGLRRRRK